MSLAGVRKHVQLSETEWKGRPCPDIIRRAGKAFIAMVRKRGDSPRIGDRDLESWGTELVAGLRELIEADQNAGYPALEAVPDEEAKGWQELSDCEDFAAELRANFGVPLCDIEKNPEQSLPDCFGRINEQRVGIEVTRLTLAPNEIAWQRNCLRSNIEALCSSMKRDDPVRSRKIQRALAAKPFKFAAAFKHITGYEQVLICPPSPKWSFDYFQTRLQAVISEKEAIAANRTEEGGLDEFDGLYLLVRTHEYNLTEDSVAEYVRRVEIPPLQHFDAAYLKLPIRPMDGPGRSSCPVFSIPAS